MSSVTIGAVVTDSHIGIAETSTFEETRRTWVTTYPSITVHTGEDTFKLPWDTGMPIPRVGANVVLTVEWEDE